MYRNLFDNLTKDLLNFFFNNGIFFRKDEPFNRENLFYFVLNDNQDDDIEDCFYIEMDDNQDNDIEDLFPKILFNGTVTLKEIFSSQPLLYEKIIQKDEWNLDEIYFKDISNIYEKYEKLNALSYSLKILYQKYLPLSEIPELGYDMLMELFHTYIVFLDQQPFKESRVQFSNTFKAILVEPINVFNDFLTLIKTEHKIQVVGSPGSGKTVFVKFCLQQNTFTRLFYDYYYLTCSSLSDVENLLNEIQFKKLALKERQDAEIRNLIAKKTVHSLLIIDDLNFSTTKLKSLSRKLQELNLTIIIIYSGTANLRGFYKFKLSYTDEELISIYEKAAYNVMEKQYKQPILNWTAKNPLLISLLAHASRSDSSLIEKIKSDPGFIPSKTAPKFKTPYDKGMLSFLGHAKSLYEIQMLTNEENSKELRDYLVILSSFSNAIVPLFFLEKILPDYQYKHLEKLTELGLIDLIPEKYVQLQPVIAEIIFEDANPAYDTLDPVINSIIQFLQYHDELMEEHLGNLLIPFIKHILPKISVSNNPKQKNVSNRQENWWRFMYMCIEYYQKIDAISYAKQIVNLLRYPERLHCQKCSSVDKIVLDLISALLEGNRKQIENDYTCIESLLRPDFQMDYAVYHWFSLMHKDKIILEIFKTRDPEKIKTLKDTYKQLEFWDFKDKELTYASIVYDYIGILLFLPPQEMRKMYIDQIYRDIIEQKYPCSFHIKSYSVILFKCFEAVNNCNGDRKRANWLLDTMEKTLLDFKELIAKVHYLPGATGTMSMLSFMYCRALFHIYGRKKVSITNKDLYSILQKCTHETDIGKENAMKFIKDHIPKHIQ